MEEILSRLSQLEEQIAEVRETRSRYRVIVDTAVGVGIGVFAAFGLLHVLGGIFLTILMHCGQ